MYCEPYKLARIVRAAKPWWLCFPKKKQLKTAIAKFRQAQPVQAERMFRQPPWSGSGTLIKPDETAACAPKTKNSAVTERRLLRAVLNRFEGRQFHALPFLLQGALHGCNQS